MRRMRVGVGYAAYRTPTRIQRVSDSDSRMGRLKVAEIARWSGCDVFRVILGGNVSSRDDGHDAGRGRPFTQHRANADRTAWLRNDVRVVEEPLDGCGNL